MVLTNPRYLHLHTSLLDTITETIAYKRADTDLRQNPNSPDFKISEQNATEKEKTGAVIFLLVPPDETEAQVLSYELL